MKSERLLVSGRVLITRVDPWAVEALVRGDTGLYRVVSDPAGWRCSCVNPSPRCSHARAVALVTVVRRDAVPDLRAAAI